MAATGGWSLSDHIQSSETFDALHAKNWNFVVLQEQSQIPSVEQFRTQEMYPAARELVDKVTKLSATPIFFITWAHSTGWPENGMNDYESMQLQINDGYLRIAQELGAPVAPVGPAWLRAVQQHPELTLWQEDGSHPTEEGYLSGCLCFLHGDFSRKPRGIGL